MKNPFTWELEGMGMIYREWEGMGISLFQKIPDFVADIFRIMEYLAVSAE